MSAPDTNTKKQAKRHWPLLGGMFLVVAFGVGIIAYWVMDVIVAAPEPRESENETITIPDIRSGNVDVPLEAPIREVTPDIINPGLNEDSAPQD